MNTAFAPLHDDELAAHPSHGRSDDPWTPIVPVPADAPALTKALAQRFAPAGYAFVGGWHYHDPNGRRLLSGVARYERPANGSPADKQVKPFTFCEGPGGRREWRCKALPEPRPLYSLDYLAARREVPVLVVEGEKVADAAAARFPDYVVTTSPGGAKAAHKADWTPLANRHVVIWPDADAPGAQYAADVANLARKAGAASVRIVRLPAGLPEGWDLADELPLGLTDDELKEMLTSAPERGEARHVVDGWPALVPIATTLPRVEPFAPELLPPALRGYVLDVAERQ